MNQGNKTELLLLHGSRFGQSTKIALAIKDVLEAANISVRLEPLEKETSIDTKATNALALVTSVRYGYFDKNAYHLINRYRHWLDTVPTLLATVSLTARNPEKRDPQVHSYTKKFLEKSSWTPSHTEVVAGALEYPRYHLFDRLAIQLIMHITKGETDPSVSIEYTDWDQVRQAGAVLANMLS